MIAIISLLALVIAIYIGFKRGINTGLVSITGAYILGFFVLEMNEKLGKEIPLSDPTGKFTTLVSGWPNSLFFILLGVTLLFGIAKVNGTLVLIARKSARLAGGNKKLIPIIFFILATVIAAIGPGNIAVCALLLPIAMSVAHEEKIGALLMAGMVIAGSNAGGLSPLAPTGIIGVTLSEKIGLANVGMRIFYNMVIAQVIIAAVIYIVLGGLKLSSRSEGTKSAVEAFDGRQKATIFVILLVVVAVIVFKAHLGLVGFAGATILLLIRAADEKEAILSVPWSTLLLVCGVGVLVNVVSLAGGITTLTDALSSFMNARTAAPIMTIIGGLMSAVSSASGVVMPTLIPTVPGLIEKLGAQVTPTALVSAIILGAHVVTNSPLSTLGALAMASAGDEVDRGKLFRELLVLGFGGILFGALIVFLGIVR
ncbi:Na+/H+ antiporter NhaD/arsenite permease-like protein [Anaerosolibacter carboniphilus]|uniref:Na+/H+ antiporter NhaD/arsenite permease-like protein n=1 Tax=Anaerosolibacter carboniphilus TaxID=1417629 RepID=A0A841L0I2_9FIRM|nr:SLC13 family permease [Anaerosolibacter carboniphilus]MBB6217710.1 Na+/H+ antiporter NhaD/arsenite permease-like protein [Anaerosolibacter carboniphilus]